VSEPGTSRLSRRSFVKIGVIGGAGLTLGIAWKATRGPGLPASDADFAPNAFLRIDSDGSVTVVVDRSEMGQGVSTALPQLLAEELDVAWDAVEFQFAPAHEAYGSRGMQVTGGSTSVAESWLPFRQAGATARWMLREAAAQRWGVPAEGLETGEGRVTGGPDRQSLWYGELASAAADIPVPADVPLKPPSDFRLIGRSLPKLDVPPKVTGEAAFGLDAGPADARVAVVARPPVFGGRVRSFDASRALAVDGVEEVVELDGGVAVVARGYVAATRGRDALAVEWEDGPEPDLDDEAIFARLRGAARHGGRVVRDDGDVSASLAGGGAGASELSVEYRLPYLAHATMEPMNCTAWVRDGVCTVWAPTQFQNSPGFVGLGARQVARKASGAREAEVVTTFLGGGFGRRAERDFVHEAAQLAGRVSGPVRVVWSREDDMRHDFYRPASYHEMAAKLDAGGRPEAWHHRMACQSILERSVPGWVPDLVAGFAGKRDPTSTEGASNHPYRVPNIRMAYAKVDLPVPVGFWRSVGHTHTGFVVESFIDELAHLAGADPYAYRRELLEAHPRHRAVLDAAAEAAGWSDPVSAGRARGIAVVESFGSYVAEVAEVSVEDGRPRVHRVWCAVDCGTVVNPRIVEAQMKSGVVFGLTAALYGRISIQGGCAVQSNFHDYPLLRIDEAPVVEVILAPSGDPPGGIGEPGVPPIAPAVTNALFALTGQRVRELPIELA
jgi:isoquinoline 1-oxidoreductase beta subunit